MRATGATMTAQFRAEDLKKRLKGLPPKVQQAILKKAMRKALQPIQAQLRSSWRAAPYRGKAPHRRAISRATVMDARRMGGRDATEIVGKVGVDYGAKKGMMQRVWHLLEAGFKRYAKGTKGAYQNFSKTAHDQKQAYKTYLFAARKRVMGMPGLKPLERGAMLRQVAADARKQFPTYVAERTTRAAQRKRSVAANNAYMPGSWRSKSIVKQMVGASTQTVRAEAIKAADQALKGGTP